MDGQQHLHLPGDGAPLAPEIGLAPELVGPGPVAGDAPFNGIWRSGGGGALKGRVGIADVAVARRISPHCPEPAGNELKRAVLDRRYVHDVPADVHGASSR